MFSELGITCLSGGSLKSWASNPLLLGDRLGAVRAPLIVGPGDVVSQPPTCFAGVALLVLKVVPPVAGGLLCPWREVS